MEKKDPNKKWKKRTVFISSSNLDTRIETIANVLKDLSLGERWSISSEIRNLNKAIQKVESLMSALPEKTGKLLNETREKKIVDLVGNLKKRVDTFQEMNERKLEITGRSDVFNFPIFKEK